MRKYKAKKVELDGYTFEDMDELYLETDEELRAEASAWLESVID